MRMRWISSVAVVLALLHLFGLSAFAAPLSSVRLSDTWPEQGAFFILDVAADAKAPVAHFLGRSFRLFRQLDGGWRAMVPVGALSVPGEHVLQVVDGADSVAVGITVRENDLPVQQIRLYGSKGGLKATEREKTSVRRALDVLSPEQLFTTPFYRPVGGEISSLFGLKRSYNGEPVTSYHKGLDIAAAAGTPVLSMGGGRVVLTGREDDGFVVHGNTVIVDHGQGLVSVYLHMQEVTVQEGELVHSGSIIGRVGDSGISTAPHLHWGTYLYGTSVDPELMERYQQ